MSRNTIVHLLHYYNIVHNFISNFLPPTTRDRFGQSIISNIYFSSSKTCCVQKTEQTSNTQNYNLDFIFSTLFTLICYMEKKKRAYEDGVKQGQITLRTSKKRLRQYICPRTMATRTRASKKAHKTTRELVLSLTAKYTINQSINP